MCKSSAIHFIFTSNPANTNIAIVVSHCYLVVYGPDTLKHAISNSVFLFFICFFLCLPVMTAYLL